jgi:hypothetical protein
MLLLGRLIGDATCQCRRYPDHAILVTQDGIAGETDTPPHWIGASHSYGRSTPVFAPACTARVNTGRLFRVMNGASRTQPSD